MNKGNRPDSYYNYRADLLQLVPKINGNVLDVGCGEGNYAFYLKERGAAFIAGVEIDSEAAAAASSKMDFVFTGSVEEKLPFEQGQFDLIICADVLEHLIDPWEALRNMKILLAPDGYLLASIPNLRYAPVLYNILIRGLFRYKISGVLDYTHLRFFTLSTMKEIIEESGFEIVKLGRPAKDRVYLVLNLLTLGLLNDFLTMQYYILARPAGEQ
jgi:2-polyprenyl-3-methyl-5-hydroxy-6-metoxy-1,4-benzoquinol methylase